MSEKLLKFLLGELKLIRVHCKKCRSQAVIELPIAKITRAFDKWACPICGEEFRKSKDEGTENYLETLMRALDGLTEAKDRVEVEFIIPEQTSK